MKEKWTKRKLGEVCDFEGGSQPPKSEFIFTQQTGYLRFLQIRDFGSEKNITYIRDSKKNRLCDENDILIGRYGASVGKVLTGKAGAYNVALMKTIPNLNVLDKSWFYYFLVSDEFQIPLLDVADRSAQAGFSKDDIYNFPIPVPPLVDQHRIVTLLDEAFADIATAKANAEKNLQNARDFFSGQLQAIFDSGTKCWTSSTLGQTYDVRDGTHDSPKYQAEGYPLITSKNLKREGLSFDDVKLIAELDYAKINERSAVHQGDVLLAMIGTIGNPTVVEIEPNFAIKNVALLKVPQTQNSYFLQYYLSTPLVIAKMQSEAKGTTQKFVGLGYLRAFPISIPALAEQQMIVEKLDALRTESERLESIYRQKLTALDDLKKSLLHQAFNGQL